MSLTQTSDSELLVQFRNPVTKEKAYTSLIRKYQEKLYSISAGWWWIMMMPMMYSRMYWSGFGTDWRISGKTASSIPGGCRVATNECLTYLEQMKKRASVSLSDVESGLSNKIKADKHFDANKLEWKLQVAIQQLPDKQELFFSLRYYDEMPYEEMSRVLETSEGALKASYHHAVKKIEDYMLNH